MPISPPSSCYLNHKGSFPTVSVMPRKKVIFKSLHLLQKIYFSFFFPQDKKHARAGDYSIVTCVLCSASSPWPAFTFAPPRFPVSGEEPQQNAAPWLATHKANLCEVVTDR